MFIKYMFNMVINLISGLITRINPTTHLHEFMRNKFSFAEGIFNYFKHVGDGSTRL